MHDQIYICLLITILNETIIESESLQTLKNRNTDWDYIRAVSYTHLDVYKRQVYLCMYKLIHFSVIRH